MVQIYLTALCLNELTRTICSRSWKKKELREESTEESGVSPSSLDVFCVVKIVNLPLFYHLI